MYTDATSKSTNVPIKAQPKKVRPTSNPKRIASMIATSTKKSFIANAIPFKKNVIG